MWHSYVLRRLHWLRLGDAHVFIGEQAREDLAQSLTAAILSHTGRQQQSALERIYQQLVCIAAVILAPMSSLRWTSLATKWK